MLVDNEFALKQNKPVYHKSYLYLVCSIAILGGLMFGFDIAIISGTVPFIQPYFGWTNLQLGWGVSSMLLGAILGSIVSGYFSEKFGRKKALLFVALFFGVSSVGTALATESNIFIIYRIIGGISVGAVSVISPMYVAEIVPSSIRGSMVSIYQLAITFGILASYLINYFLHDWDDNWRWMFMTGVIPSVIFFIGLFLIPESPRWLYLHGQREKALAVLLRINDEQEALTNYNNLQNSQNVKNIKISFKELLQPSFRKPIVLGFLLAVLVQITGINTIIDYAPKILMAAGVEIKNALLQTSLIGIINFSFTFIAIWLVDKLGRKPLYLAGSALMGLALAMLSLTFYFEWSSYFALAGLLFFIASFASCIGPVFWTLVAEIFPNRIRGQALAFTSFTQWVFNFFIVLLFPHVLSVLGGATTFLLLIVMCIVQFVITHYYMPETKGKSLEEIEKLWE
jgi:sugar porter (SP) family MFS transporter